MSEENKDQRDFDLIEAYLMNTMNEGDLKVFEEELERRSDLKADLQIQKDLVKAIQIGGLKEELKTIHQTNQGSRREKRSIPIWGIAASIAVILALSIWTFTNESAEADLFAEYSTVDPGLPVTMGTTNNYDFSDAMVDYKRGDYEKAISKWSGLYLTMPDSDTLNFYIGMAHFNMGEFDQAKIYIEKANTSESKRMRAKAQWYEVLIAIKKDNQAFIKDLKIVEGSEFEERILEIQKAVKE